jgi:hypothetical protein
MEIDFIKKDMNRELIVTLLRKDIQELDMITEGFMEMAEYPKAIINLALLKSKDIQSYIEQLDEIKPKNLSSIEIEDASTEIKETTETEIITDTFNSESEVEEFESEVIEIEVETAEFIENKEEPFEEVSESIENTETETTETIKSSDGETKSIVLNEKISIHTQSRNEKHIRNDNSISSTLANKKIDDIKQAINIGDRFRFQRELFKGNGEDMNKTLSYINQLESFDEVESFLQSKYNWDVENEAVEDFYQIIRRRFI